MKEIEISKAQLERLLDMLDLYYYKFCIPNCDHNCGYCELGAKKSPYSSDVCAVGIVRQGIIGDINQFILK